MTLSAYRFSLKIDNTHPLFSYLEPNPDHLITDNAEVVLELLPPMAYNFIFLTMHELFECNESFSIITNSFYSIDSDNYLSNFGKIGTDCKDFLKSILRPTCEVTSKKTGVFRDIYKMEELHQYSVIHLRFGDKFIHDKTAVDHDKYNTYCGKVRDILDSNTDKSYILITDSSEMANRIKTDIGRICYWENSKVHLGDLKSNDDDGTAILDTMVDFFIMAGASEILSNGSGFSTIVSEIYDVTYRPVF